MSIRFWTKSATQKREKKKGERKDQSDKSQGGSVFGYLREMKGEYCKIFAYRLKLPVKWTKENVSRRQLKFLLQYREYKKTCRNCTLEGTKFFVNADLF